ncbi:tetratricopeptide repeat protein [Solitalea longa]|uniref:tetratricopeptide repeat protein n=1 Tax=Solitalea longa TaxID=2079460 RepID=UPI0013FE2BCB|nr:tetratricopeptide repeat protein [Solitalea longa]
MKRIYLICLTCLLSIGAFAQTTNNIDTLINQGIKLHDAGNYTEAINKYEAALKINNNSTLANYEMAFSYYQLKDYEKTFAYCNKVFAYPEANEIIDAYILSGNALDITGKAEKAVETYKTAIKTVKPTYLLYFNLAVTYFGMEQYDNAETEIINALRLNSEHAASHLVLAKTMIQKGNRVKAVLALYNFLLLGASGERGTEAYKKLDELLKQGVTKSSEKTINITLGNSKDEFLTAEFMLSMIQATNTSEANKLKTDAQLFAENTKLIFSTLAELKKERKGFWWNFYVDFYDQLVKSNNVEAFAYYISLAKDDASVREWIKRNEESLKAMEQWYEKTERRF